MTRYALVKNNLVDNVIIADAAFVAGLAGITAVALPDASTVSAGYTYNGNAFLAPVVDLTALKTQKNLQINAWRMAANLSTFPYAGKQIACDDLSRSDIDAVAGSISLTGSFPPGFPNAWKATDNTMISVPDIATFKAIYSAMTAQGTANFTHSQALKTALAAANTQADIDAIIW